MKPAEGTETILFAEDEEEIRILGLKLLSRARYTVLTVSGGLEALQIYRNKGTDISLVLLDLVMPSMGGKQCLEELLKLDSTAKVIVASGYAHEGEARKLLELGAKSFVGNPFSSGELLKTIRTVLDTDNERAENRASPNTPPAPPAGLEPDQEYPL